MKKTKILIVLLLLELSIFSSCSNDTPSSTSIKPSSENFIGEWYDDKNQTLIISENYITYKNETFPIDNLKFGSELSTSLPVLKNNLFIKNDDFTFEYLKNNALICRSISYSYTDIETNENLTLFVTFNEALDLMAAMEYVQTTLEDGSLLRYGEVVNPQTILKPLTCTLSGDVLEYIKSPITINTSDAMYLFLKDTINEDTYEIISSWLKLYNNKDEQIVELQNYYYKSYKESFNNSQMYTYGYCEFNNGEWGQFEPSFTNGEDYYIRDTYETSGIKITQTQFSKSKKNITNESTEGHESIKINGSYRIEGNTEGSLEFSSNELKFYYNNTLKNTYNISINSNLLSLSYSANGYNFEAEFELSESDGKIILKKKDDVGLSLIAQWTHNYSTEKIILYK